MTAGPGAPAGVPFRRKGEDFTQATALLEPTAGRRLRALRLSHGLTVASVAQALDCSDIAVKQLEGNARPTSKLIPRACALYGVTVDEVVRPFASEQLGKWMDEDWSRQSLAWCVSRMRSDLAYDLAEFARVTGMPYMSLWRLERGKFTPSATEIAGIARVTGYPARLLLEKRDREMAA